MKHSPHTPPPPFTYRMMQAVMAPILKIFGLSCKNAFHLSSEQMDRKLTKRESIILRIHLLMCGVCRRLPAQFQGMRTLIKACNFNTACGHNHPEPEIPDVSMSPEAQKRIEESLLKQKKS